MNRRKILITGAIILAATAALYSAAWLYAAGQVRDGIEGWAEERRAEGWSIAYGSLTTGGFLFSLRGRLDAPVVSRHIGGETVSWRGPAINVTIRPWEPGHLAVSFPGSHEITRRGRTAQMMAKTADARVELTDGGQVELVHITLGAVTATPAKGAPKTTMERLALTLDRPVAAESDAAHQRALVRLKADVTGLVLAKGTRAALGRRLENASATGVILGAMPAAPLAEALAAWRDGGGTIEIKRFRLAWATLSINAEGTMALDRELQPQAALTARIMGFRETIDRLTANGTIKPRKAMTAKIVLGLLARGNPPEITASISAQDGGLYIGPVRLMPLPRVRWN